MQETEKLSKSDLSKYGEDIQALLINLMGDPFCPNSVKLKRLNELDIKPTKTFSRKNKSRRSVLSSMMVVMISMRLSRQIFQILKKN